HGRFRLGNAGEASELAYEADQGFTAFADGLERKVDIAHLILTELIRVFVEVLFKVAFDGSGQRRNRRDGGHDLMGQHPHQILPGVHFLFFKLALDILERHQLDVITFECELYGIHRQLHDVVVQFEAKQFATPSLYSANHIHQRCAPLVEIVDMIYPAGSEQATGSTVKDFDFAIFLDDNKADPHVHYNVPEEQEFRVAFLA